MTYSAFLRYILSKYLASMLPFNFSNGNMLFQSQILVLPICTLLLHSIPKGAWIQKMASIYFAGFFSVRKYIEMLHIHCHYKKREGVFLFALVFHFLVHLLIYDH